MNPHLNPASNDRRPHEEWLRAQPHQPSHSFEGGDLVGSPHTFTDDGLTEVDGETSPEAHSDLTKMTLTALDREVGELSVRMNIDSFRLLAYVAEFERRNAWFRFGCLSGAQYLNWRCGIALGAAREKVRTALALNDLPLISRAFRHGRLSYSKVRALTRIAVAANEADLLDLALKSTASHLASHVRRHRQGLAASEPALLFQSRSCRTYWKDNGLLLLVAELPAEQGAAALKALDRATVDIGPLDSDASEDQKNAHRCDALSHALGGFLEHGGGKGHAADRFMLHVDVPAAALRAKVPDDGAAEQKPREHRAAEHGAPQAPVAPAPLPPVPLATLENDGPPLSPQTLRRLCCDASIVFHPESADAGHPPARRTRTIPAWLRRKVQRRDGGCRFPGCTNTRFVDVHHIRHWADGGDTTPRNLVTLCRRHHTMVHEFGYRIETQDEGRIRFFQPSGDRELQATGDRRSRGGAVNI